MCKVVERLIKNRVQDFLERNRLLAEPHHDHVTHTRRRLDADGETIEFSINGVVQSDRSGAGFELNLRVPRTESEPAIPHEHGPDPEEIDLEEEPPAEPTSWLGPQAASSTEVAPVAAAPEWRGGGGWGTRGREERPHIRTPPREDAEPREVAARRRRTHARAR